MAARCRGEPAVAYIIEGQGHFGGKNEPTVANRTLVLFDDGEEVVISTAGDLVRFLLISGTPLGEPVAWQVPIVMNTQEELQIAFAEYRKGSFLKHH